MSKESRKKPLVDPFEGENLDREVPLPGDGLVQEAPHREETGISDERQSVVEGAAHKGVAQKSLDGLGGDDVAEARSGAVEEGFLSFLRGDGRWRWWLLYALGSYFVVFEKIKYLSVYGSFRVDWFRSWELWHTALMNNKGSAPNQYRVLSTILAECFHQWGISAFTSYQLLRFVCTFLTCLVLHWLWRRWLRDIECFGGVMLFLLFSAMSLLPLIQPAEPLNILVFAACLSFLSGKRWVPFYVCLFLGSFNKLTVVFLAPVVFFFLLLDAASRDRKAFVRATLHALATGGVAIGVRLGLLAMLGVQQYYTSVWKVQENLGWMASSLAGWSFLLITVLPLVGIWSSWKRQPRLVQAHALMLPLFMVGHFSITIVAEVRTFVVTLCLSVPGLLLWMRSSQETSSSEESGSRSVL